MRILFDTNVVLDVLEERAPHHTDAATLFSAVDRGWITGLLCATTITTIHYIARQTLDAARKAQFAAQLSHAVTAYHLGATTEALRQLLAAVTAELYGDPDEDEVRIPGQRPQSPDSATGAAA